MSKLIIGADIVPTKSNTDIFESSNMEKIVDRHLLDLLNQADYRIFNLEVPLTDVEDPIPKCGPNLIAGTKSINGYKQLGIDFLTLANNHIMDQGKQGLLSTIHVLDTVGIAYAGIGNTLCEAMKPFFIKLANMKIGVYCCAEHEFSIATEKQAGANPFDPLESPDHIAALKEKCDYVICLYHGGKEHYRYPSPYLQKTCRKIAEKGADLVICQHSHCIGCEEKWMDSTIVYGQGNFIFDSSESEFWQTSVLVSVDVEKKQVNYIPIHKVGKGIKLASGKDAEQILGEMQKRNEQIKRAEFIDSNYSRFAESMIDNYLNTGDILTNTFLFRVINKLCGHRLGKYIAKNKAKKYGTKYINQYECEAHRELILKGIHSYE